MSKLETYKEKPVRNHFVLLTSVSFSKSQTRQEKTFVSHSLIHYWNPVLFLWSGCLTTSLPGKLLLQHTSCNITLRSEIVLSHWNISQLVILKRSVFSLRTSYIPFPAIWHGFLWLVKLNTLKVQVKPSSSLSRYYLNRQSCVLFYTGNEIPIFCRLLLRFTCFYSDVPRCNRRAPFLCKRKNPKPTLNLADCDRF